MIKITTKDKWYRGTVKVNYNLMWVVLPFYLFAMIFVALWQGLVWCAKKFWQGCCAFGRKMKNLSPGHGKWWVVILLAFLAIFLLLCLRDCSSTAETEPEDGFSSSNVYEEAFDDVVIARAYLDGVQQKATSSCPTALLGMKFINGKPASTFDFTGKTYDEAVKVIADDWRPFVAECVRVELSEAQMTVVILTAMRMGNAGFKRSTFLKLVNEGRFDDAADWFVLQDSKGEIRQTGDEPKQYFTILRMLWQGDIAVDDLMDFPIWSYKNLKVGYSYSSLQEMIDVLTEGNNPTPRMALDLD